ncbi:DUF1707 and DUF4870 domain-containing protein [Nocardiopsis rhodophaea]|uniref:DUF1707 and DUF4870 domain-containing protein n=1 Tax=Nocardiopsis rhodophaea TaxID=280238 RepID=UPI0031E40361
MPDRFRAPADPAIRLTHADRDAAAETLKEAYADGRLDDDEFEERLGLAMQAKFPADLEPLFSDIVPRNAGMPTSSPKAHMPETPPTGSERLWAAGGHVSGYFLFPLGPLLVLLANGNTSPFVRRHAVEALNYQLTFLIGSIVLLGLSWLIIPVLVWIPMLLGWIFMPVIAGFVGLVGGRWKYPFTWRPVRE